MVEKHEKILREKRLRARRLFGAAITIFVILGIWSLTSDPVKASVKDEVSKDLARVKNQLHLKRRHVAPPLNDKNKKKVGGNKKVGGKKKMGGGLNTKKQQKVGQEVKKKIRKNASEKENKKKEPSVEDTSNLIALVEMHDAKVRTIKSNLPKGHFMETDPTALVATKALQDATRKLLHRRYGPNEPYRIEVSLEFQSTMPDFEEKGANGSFVIEMGPTALIPHSVFTFMELARLWEDGAFHRVAGHVLQAKPYTKPPKIKPLAFQEYSDKYQHKKGTVGYAGRPSGPGFYVSIQSNIKNHGPGSQQKDNPNEADALFGTVVEGFEEVVLERITKMPGKGFIHDRKKQVRIKELTIMVPKKEGSAKYVKWHDFETNQMKA